MRALFLPRYGPLAGSSRYMSYDFLDYYADAGIACDIAPLLDDRYLLNSQAQRRGEQMLTPWQLRRHLAAQLGRRLAAVLSAARYDVVVLEKDTIPYAPYAVDALLLARNPRLVVMYDEATYDFYAQHPNRWVRMFNQGKVERIIRRAAHIVAWNPSVRDYVTPLNPNVTTLTTGIDLRRYHVKPAFAPSGDRVRIGWIGTPSGYAYLHELDSVFAQLAQEHALELYVVSSEPYQVSASGGVNVVNRRWSVQTEIQDLQAMDIGIMPLSQDEWASGKSGCKMLQYMGVGLPVVVSPVGINAEVVDEGRNGMLARTPDEWRIKLKQLIQDVELRRRLGLAGRQYVEAHNSQAVIAAQLTAVLQKVAGKMPAQPDETRP